MDTSKQYDVSKNELNRIQRRAELRNKLKMEFNKKAANPFRGAFGQTIVRY